MSELSNYIKNDDTFQPKKLPNGKSIGIKGWNVGQENQMLYNIDSKPDDRDHSIMESINLVRKCVDDQKLFDQLSRNNILYLIVQTRKLSKGGIINLTFNCVNTECPMFREYPKKIQEQTGKLGTNDVPLDAEIDLDDSLEIKVFDTDPFVSDDTTFYFKEISFLNQRQLEKEYLSDPKNYQVNKFNFELLIDSIEKIIIDDKEMDDFNRDELVAYINKLNPGLKQLLMDDFISKQGSFKIKKKVTCPHCQKSEDLEYDNIYSILVF